MPIKFLVDFMLGKLAKELRILGFDVRYLKPQAVSSYNPLTLLRIGQSEQRIILTRNTKLKDYSGVLFITSEKTDEQIAQVTEYYKLNNEVKPFSRCLVCNEILKPIPKSEVKGKVPFYIFQTQNKFSWCENCNKIYWAGTHLKDMQKRIKGIKRKKPKK
jgi:uncharacterized protein with PIN domain